jgi:DNA primase
MSVEKLLQQLGIQYRVIEDEAYSSCPFHSPDDHPSWYINLKSGLHHCFSCRARGNLCHLLVHVLQLSYAEAVIQANDIVGAARVGEWQENYYRVSFSPPAIKVTEADKALFTDPPREALHDKNITLDAAQYYGIQWNPEHESWICPYYDPYSNELWGWQEKNKRVFRNFPAGTKKSKTLFGYPQLKNMSAMLVESPVDCAVANSAGYENTVASFGLPNVYQLYLMQIRVDSFIFALDNDGPGKKATRELIPEALKMFRNVKVLPYLYTKAKDIGEMNYQSIRTEIAEAEPALAWIRRNSG